MDGLSPVERQHLIGVQGNVWTEHVRTEERVEWMTWPRAAAVAELGWSPLERLDYPDFRRRVEAATGWYRRIGLRYATTELEPAPAPAKNARSSQELESCTDTLVLNLEDDGPVAGPRAHFLVDIMNPCWLWRGADLGNAVALKARVGQFPFNFQIGKDRDTIRLKTPATDAGELEVRVDGCDGVLLATLPLAPARDADGVTQLPPAKISPRPGAHDLCFTFTARDIDPMWAIDRVELREATAASEEAVHAR
jgi:hexosaminidase